MAKALGVHVVAEGVETIAQLELLDELGCEFAQGQSARRARRARRPDMALAGIAPGGGFDIGVSL